MNTKKKIVALSICSATLLFSSCEKQNDSKIEKEINGVNINSAHIDSLKTYISNMIDIEPSEINFNKERNEFILKEGLVIKQKEIEQVFLNSPTINYLDGKNVDKK